MLAIRQAFLAMLGVCALSALWPRGHAQAYEEQMTFAFGPTYTVLPAPEAGRGRHGVGGALELTYGLGDTFSIVGRVDHTAFLGSDSAHFSRAAVGVSYAVDVLRLVPIFGVGIGGALGLHAGEAAGDPLAYGSFSLDYLVSRRWLFGGDVRAELLPFDRLGIGMIAVSAGVRLALVIDRF